MIKIQSILRQDSANIDEKDVFAVKHALVKTGHYDVPEYGITPYPDKALFGAIKDFQKENGLRTDGIIKPEGETLSALNNSEDTSPEDEDPDIRSPSTWCPTCGGPHGGSAGDECPDCASK